jgi:23S rRNA pseudouridine2605 synthase
MENNHNQESENTGMRLNKYLAHAGISNRRKAEEIIAQGVVKINGVVVTNPAHKVSISDHVTLLDKTIKAEKKIYLVLNKPRKFSVNPGNSSKNVQEIVKNAGAKAGIGHQPEIAASDNYADTDLGLLVFTNDSEFIGNLQKAYAVYKISLSNSINEKELAALKKKIEKASAATRIKELALPLLGDNTVLGIEGEGVNIDSLKQVFFQSGHEVVQTDRVLLSIITKKDLPRGKWRFLSEKEISAIRIL